MKVNRCPPKYLVVGKNSPRYNLIAFVFNFSFRVYSVRGWVTDIFLSTPTLRQIEPYDGYKLSTGAYLPVAYTLQIIKWQSSCNGSWGIGTLIISLIEGIIFFCSFLAFLLNMLIDILPKNILNSIPHTTQVSMFLRYKNTLLRNDGDPWN